MKALVKQQKGDGFVALLEVPEPKIGPRDILLRVGASGICGSDLMILHDFFPAYNVPVILGHEFAGIVEEVGSDVSSFSRGEHVVSETHAYVCGECAYCKSGKYNLCPSRKGFGYGVDGAFAGLVKVREPIVHKLPDNISIEEAAVLEPLSVAVNALTQNSRIKAGDSVVIFGPGPIGLLCLQLAKLSGATVTMVGTERSKGRLELASRVFGADDVMTSVEFSQLLDEGKMVEKFDVAVVATGTPEAFEPALRAVRRTGTVVHVGESTKQASFQFSFIERKNLTVQGSFSHNWPVWERAISLATDGRIKLRQMVTHEVRLDEWKKGFELAETRKALKVLIKP